MNKEDWLFVAIAFALAFVIAAVALEKRDLIQFKAKCEASGGMYYKGRRESPLCLKSNSMIPIATAARG